MRAAPCCKISLACLLMLVLGSPCAPGQAVPQLLNVQGRLADGTNLVNGSVPLSFRIYPAEFSAAPIFEDSNAVAVADGLYSTLLGDQVTLGSLSNVFTASADAWLEVLVNGAALTPRERIVSSGYAIMAGNLPDGAITSIKIASGAIQSNHIAAGAIATVHIQDAAITSNKVAVNAISASNIQSGAITSNKLAPDSVTFSNLAKAYLSGTTNLSLPYEGTTVNFTVTFNPKFQATPIVTTGLRCEGGMTSNFPAAGPWITARTTNNFSARVQLGHLARASEYLGNEQISAIAVGSSSLRMVADRPAVSFVGTLSDLEYYRALDTNGAAWDFASFFIDALADGTCLEVVGGNPAIAYITNSGVHSLMFVRSLDATGGAWGALTRVDAAESSDPSLLVVSGNPSIAYREEGTGTLKYVHAFDTTGATWAAAVSVDTNVGSGFNPTLLVISNNPAISYAGPTGTIRYVRSSDTVGNAWPAPVIVSTNGSNGTGPIMAIVAGNPAIAYSDFTKKHLLFVRAANASGTVWNAPVLVLSNAMPTGRAVAMAVVRGVPVLAYSTTSNSLGFVRAANATGTVWNAPTIIETSSGSVLEPGLLSLNNLPAVAATEVATDSMRFTIVSNVALGVDWVAVEP